ncbi:MAG: hypothetical protein ACLGI6_08600 [Gammaproteobacteria bacterium]
MHARLPYAKVRLSAAIDRFLTAQTRQDKAAAARWVSAWAHFTELYTSEGLERRSRHSQALSKFL